MFISHRRAHWHALITANKLIKAFQSTPNHSREPAAPYAMENPQFPVQFDGKSYDLNKFMRDHPGGVNTLKFYKGKSIKSAMSKFGHSYSAYHMLNDMKVAEVLKDVNLSGAVSGNGRIITKDDDTRNVEEIAFLEELEARLDWSKPILSQLEAIAPHYQRWVNSAVYRECRLFANPLLEAMTYTPWYLVPAFWVPVILYLGYSGYVDTVACGDSCASVPLSSLQFLIHLLQGVILWTALEYCLHRWVFHLDPGTSIFMIRLHFILHGMHHKVPFDGYRQVFPPLPAAAITYVLYSMLCFVIPSYPSLKLVGSLVGYLTYDMIHFYVHHGSPADGTYLYTMKRYHSNHHFINHHKAFGISCNIWDHVFSTFVRVKKLGFSLHW